LRAVLAGWSSTVLLRVNRELRRVNVKTHLLRTAIDAWHEDTKAAFDAWRSSMILSTSIRRVERRWRTWAEFNGHLLRACVRFWHTPWDEDTRAAFDAWRSSMILSKSVRRVEQRWEAWIDFNRHLLRASVRFWHTPWAEDTRAANTDYGVVNPNEIMPALERTISPTVLVGGGTTRAMQPTDMPHEKVAELIRRYGKGQSRIPLKALGVGHMNRGVSSRLRLNIEVEGFSSFRYKFVTAIVPSDSELQASTERTQDEVADSSGMLAKVDNRVKHGLLTKNHLFLGLLVPSDSDPLDGDPLPPHLKVVISKLVGEHEVGWTAAEHFGSCGSACLCCVAANEEDWPGGCEICLDSWHLASASRTWAAAVCGVCDGALDDALTLN
jgi:hypothetical protein